MIYRIIVEILIFIDVMIMGGGWYWIEKKNYSYGPEFNKWRSILTLVVSCLVVLVILLVLLLVVI